MAGSGSQRHSQRPALISSPGFLGAVARFWQRSYASDYLGLAVLITLYILTVLFVEPFHRMFSLDTRAIQFPHAKVERVSVPWLFIYAGAVPLGILVAWVVVTRPGLHKVHVTILGLFVSLILTSFVTDVIKNAVGRPRPDLIDRCQPREGTPQHELITFEACTQADHHVLHDGWRSFPSGHSSFAFSGLGYLSLFLAGQLYVFHPRTDLFRFLVFIFPLLGAALIAISRCEDYRHDVYDVTIGSVLGFSLAYFTYRRYYPRLRHPHCDEPFPNRADTAGFSKIKDEEQRIQSARNFELDIEDEESELHPLAGSSRSSTR